MSRLILIIDKQRQRFSALQNQPNDSAGVYGGNMPRLLKRIEEEFKRGKFRQKPVGPLGKKTSSSNAI